MHGHKDLNCITIIGLGLIGGSLAKSMRRVYSNVHITIIERDIDTCKLALSDGVASSAFSSYTSEAKEKLLQSDIIFFCTGIDACESILKDIYPFINGENGKKPIISDVCSTKDNIKNIFQTYKVNYIGGHPMAGSEKSGYGASSPYLLENAIYVLCPNENTDDSDMEMMKSVVINIGALPFVMESGEHDEVMSQISHLPHLVASVLVNSAMRYKDDSMIRALAAGGFKDITRIASGDAELWKNILSANRENVCASIDNIIEMLSEFRKMLANSDGNGIYEFLEEARIGRESFETGRKTIMNLLYEINIDVPDKPGIIAEVSVKLLKNNINIRNIYIAESRDNELGCLRLAFDSKDARDKAAKVLGVEV